MKTHHFLIASTLLAATLGAAAQALPEAPALTRAEVLADLDLYRESGLSRLNDGPVISNFTPEYQVALRRYRELRASPRYAELVRQHGGEPATATAQAPAAATQR
ncbi:DUF4148 domain-containing protein [Pelomonas sp. KK5]|uniref:DUF4148 domain-containing protein n=1 Tax=Pelomonas sp. KK5 TaxID=1855730 RepID=UPI00097C93BD|nr:DUF4148 domain-containing protein [Pelomonas sp. KK5]